MAQLEICADNLQSVTNAVQAGAHRIELCGALSEGGITPTVGFLAQAQKLTPNVWPLVRIRRGDFYYSPAEIDAMCADIEAFAAMGAPGAVVGALTVTGDIDVHACKAFFNAAGSMPLAFHRAVDIGRSIEENIQQIIGLGFCRVLSSGGEPTAIAGAKVLAGLVSKYGNHIQIMPGSGITAQNILTLAAVVKAPCYHASCKHTVASAMQFIKTNVHMGNNTHEYELQVTEVNEASALVKTLACL